MVVDGEGLETFARVVEGEETGGVDGVDAAGEGAVGGFDALDSRLEGVGHVLEEVGACEGEWRLERVSEGRELGGGVGGVDAGAIVEERRDEGRFVVP